MIMFVHVPFADLANAIALFDWLEADYLTSCRPYGPNNLVSCMIKGNKCETEERIVQMTEGTEIRFSFSNYKGNEVKDFVEAFGKKALRATRDLNPKNLGITKERLL